MSINIGDQVIIYSNRDHSDSIIVTVGATIQSRFGIFKHDDMVGVAWGSKFSSANGRGFVYLLKPTPELWTLSLPHRTQILYLPDISFITSYLALTSGSRIIEAGTGSGSFTHSLARTVGPQGKVFTFEYHEERYNKALVEFQDHKIDDVVRLKHRDVCKDGFGDESQNVDAVFLDLPTPWTCLPAAIKALRRDVQSRICCFSPCIEQVLKTTAALAENGFSNITMYETLTRTHDPAVVLNPSIDSAIQKIQTAQGKQLKRREGQILEAKRKREAKAKVLEESKDGKSTPDTQDVEEDSSKKRKIEESTVDKDLEPSEKEDLAKISVAKAGALLRGHTSFLTFATLLPLVREESNCDVPREESANKTEMEVNA